MAQEILFTHTNIHTHTLTHIYIYTRGVQKCRSVVMVSFIPSARMLAPDSSEQTELISEVFF